MCSSDLLPPSAELVAVVLVVVPPPQATKESVVANAKVPPTSRSGPLPRGKLPGVDGFMNMLRKIKKFCRSLDSQELQLGGRYGV